jgi:hypothetical protein
LMYVLKSLQIKIEYSSFTVKWLLFVLYYGPVLVLLTEGLKHYFLYMLENT